MSRENNPHGTFSQLFGTIRQFLLLRRLTPEELYETEGEKVREQSFRNTALLQGFLTKNSASPAKQIGQELIDGAIFFHEAYTLLNI